MRIITMVWLFESGQQFKFVAFILNHADSGDSVFKLANKKVLNFSGKNGLSGLLVNDKSQFLANLQISESTA